jgi:hypothetical protein
LSPVLKKKFCTVEELFTARWVKKINLQHVRKLESKLERQEEDLAFADIQISTVLSSQKVPRMPSILPPDNHLLHNRILDADEPFKVALTVLQDAKGLKDSMEAFTTVLNVLYVLGEMRGIEKGRSDSVGLKEKRQHPVEEETRVVAGVQSQNRKAIVLEGFEPDIIDLDDEEDPETPHPTSQPTFAIAAVQTEPLANHVTASPNVYSPPTAPDKSFSSIQHRLRRRRRRSRKSKAKAVQTDSEPAPSGPNSPVFTRKHPEGIGLGKPVEVHIIQDARYDSLKPKQGKRSREESWHGHPMLSELGRILVMLGRSRRFDLFS